MDKTKEIRRECFAPTGLQIRENDGGESRTITGYAILFDTPSAPMYDDGEEEAREIISAEAVTRELLDTSDIKMTMFHDRQLILARSRKGAGTLKYSVDEKGVLFEFEAPATVDGDKALELVRRGDISGCSFAFSTRYYDRQYVSRDVERKNGKTLITYTVRVITGLYDFTLAADPAYPDTSCAARELVQGLMEEKPSKEKDEERERIREQIGEMRRAASRCLRIV